MHMADALVSPPVAVVAGTISAALLVVAAKKVKDMRSDTIVPLMGVMGAFIFAAQMINFSIPGTGSSGHVIGGVLLTTILGPWAALITLASVLVIQCFIFADGGLMALGCNILNMAVCTCLIAYPLVFKPLMRYPSSSRRIVWLSVLTCVIGLELGALAVTLETAASGITALPIGKFLLFMLPIHLLIGIGEGLATAAVIYFIQRYKPELLSHIREGEAVETETGQAGLGKAILIFALLAVLLGSSFHWIASPDPDGLEWSIAKIAGHPELPVNPSVNAYGITHGVQSATALMPDYNTSFAGIVGGVLVVMLTWVVSSLLRYKRKMISKHHE